MEAAAVVVCRRVGMTCAPRQHVHCHAYIWQPLNRQMAQPEAAACPLICGDGESGWRGRRLPHGYSYAAIEVVGGGRACALIGGNTARPGSEHWELHVH